MVVVRVIFPTPSSCLPSRVVYTHQGARYVKNDGLLLQSLKMDFNASTLSTENKVNASKVFILIQMNYTNFRFLATNIRMKYIRFIVLLSCIQIKNVLDFWRKAINSEWLRSSLKVDYNVFHFMLVCFFGHVSVIVYHCSNLWWLFSST